MQEIPIFNGDASLVLEKSFDWLSNTYYIDVIMSTMASHITSLTIVYWTVCAGNSPVTGEFPAQMASNAEMFPVDDVIIWSSPKGYAQPIIT